MGIAPVMILMSSTSGALHATTQYGSLQRVCPGHARRCAILEGEGTRFVPPAMCICQCKPHTSWLRWLLTIHAAVRVLKYLVYCDVVCMGRQVDVLPTVHGSGVFTRGETQTLATVALGPPVDSHPQR